ncbi:guanine nucleotide-binding protein subunit alpha-11-like isoform X2 [Littorina saxatilis]|uniref:guanine nucleotide-binding protein subunit alpha-11-like isoform X2 n=1 Tax=Littorina saxatilis TaxID=31220 RepID=UPI0038B4D14C
MININKTFTLSAMNKGGRAALARSKSIDHQIDEDRERMQKEVQLLILGSAGAGKSTFIKQLRLHYGDRFPEQTRSQFTQYVLYNVTCALHIIMDQMELMGIKYDNQQNQQKAAELREKHPRISLDTILRRYKEEEDRCQKICPSMSRADVRHRLTLLDVYVPHVADVTLLQQLWTDCGVQCCYARRLKFPRKTLTPTYEYFLENVDRILTTDYVPAIQDILHIRWPTLGMQEHVFTMDHLLFKVIDVAGQKSLRKKWIHFFEGVTAVLFFVALSGYDEAVEEEPSMNMMQDSLQAFHEVSHNHFLEKTDFILFLNKKDIFVNHIQVTGLTKCFPHYKGPPHSAEDSLRFIKDQFIQHKPGHKQMYTHLTCAVDVPHMRDVLTSVMDKIVDINVKRSQLH